ncbi:Sec1-like protein [Dichotomocladium elegans]|nr:Sec1-like protein [Dichotomocladium elegans]
MDVVKAVQHYVEKMISDVPGMKVLLLDTMTTPIVSLVTTQSALLTKECYLIDRIDNRNRERMKHLKCICFLRPSPESLRFLIDELREPAYGDYYIYFSNTILKADIERLAETDDHEVVREVQEYYGDYLAINSDLFSLGMEPSNIFGDSPYHWNREAFDQTVRGISSVLLSLKKKPVIRYQGGSPMAAELAQEKHIQREGQLFDFRRPDTPPILLILDRRNDPVTPLLTQWTYQAMVHDLIGIHHGRVDLSNVPDVRSELKEIVLSPDQDQFFKKSMYLNLGDLGATIKQYVDEYQSKTKSNMNIESIADMKRFVEDYPEFRKLSGNVSKHVALVSELSRRVAQDHLLEISELEQGLACNENHNSDFKSVQKMIGSDISEDAKVRLVLLYALRYERMQNNGIKTLVDLLDQAGVSERKSSLVPAILMYAGSQQRQDDLFSNQTFLSRGKSALKGLKGVENVYTQHTPLFAETLDMLIKARLRDTSYPWVTTQNQPVRERPQDIIVFFIGGTTYEEARYIAQLNATTPGVRVVLGGTNIHNSSSNGTVHTQGEPFVGGFVIPAAAVQAPYHEQNQHSPLDTYPGPFQKTTPAPPRRKVRETCKYLEA